MKKFLSALALASAFSLLAPVGASASTIASVSPNSALSPSASISAPSILSVTVPMARKKAKAKTKISSNTLNGKTRYYLHGKTYKVKGKTTRSGAKRTVILQRYNSSSKKWTKYRTTKVSSNGSFSFTLPKNMSSSKLRFRLPETSKHKAYTGPTTEVKRKKASSSVSISSPVHARTIPWQQNKVSAQVSVGLKQKATVSLQERKPGAKKWKTVSKKTGVSRGKVSFSLPKGNKSSKDMKIQYRVVVSSTKKTNSASSKAVNVQWDNPYNGKRLEREAYDHIRKYCPNTSIILSSAISDGSMASGTAQMGKNTITIGTNTSFHYLETLALHECAHLRQWELYKSHWGEFEKKMNKIHKTKGDLGVERNAHCIAHQWSKNSFWTYDTHEKMCTTGETGKAARLIASGKKY